MMDLAVAIGTDTPDPTRIVWSAIGQTPGVVWLKVGRAIGLLERGRLVAGLTNTVCSCEYVTGYRCASLIVVRLGLWATGGLTRDSSRIGFFAQQIRRNLFWRGARRRFGNRLLVLYQMEDDDVALMTIAIRGPLATPKTRWRMYRDSDIHGPCSEARSSTSPDGLSAHAKLFTRGMSP